MDIDLIIDTSLENEAKAYRALRAKDAADLVFLREYFKAGGEEPPAV